MGVSKNRGKTLQIIHLFIGFPLIINHPFWGENHLFLETPIWYQILVPPLQVAPTSLTSLFFGAINWGPRPTRCWDLVETWEYTLQKKRKIQTSKVSVSGFFPWTLEGNKAFFFLREDISFKGFQSLRRYFYFCELSTVIPSSKMRTKILHRFFSEKQHLLKCFWEKIAMHFLTWLGQPDFLPKTSTRSIASQSWVAWRRGSPSAMVKQVKIQRTAQDGTVLEVSIVWIVQKVPLWIPVNLSR